MALLAFSGAGAAQEPSRAELLAIAREVVAGAPFVSLTTVDEDGIPAVRAMDPLPPDENWVVWLATNPDSRKVEQLRARPAVALHYLAEGVPAYVTLIGRARLVDDPEAKARHWKESWTPFYSDRDQSVLLIEVTPIRLEVVSEAHGAPGDPETWRAHVVEFGVGAASRPQAETPATQACEAIPDMVRSFLILDLGQITAWTGHFALAVASGHSAPGAAPRELAPTRQGEEHGESFRSTGTGRRLQGFHLAHEMDAGVSVRRYRRVAPARMVQCQ